MRLTAVIARAPGEGRGAFVEEPPGANIQGATLEEARENLREAATPVHAANREPAEQAVRGRDDPAPTDRS